MKTVFVFNVILHVFLTETLIQQSAALYAPTCEDSYTPGLSSCVYTIQPADQPFPVYCDYSTAGSPWTVIQRRSGPQLDFYRSWTEYENGFGNVNGDHWIGNSKINQIMNANQNTRLRIELTDWNNQTCYAQYELFHIGDASQLYELNSLSGYSGTCGDSLSYHLGMKFSTKDRDFDASPGENCAARYNGAFWYKQCLNANLNGPYVVGGGPVDTAQGITWLGGRGHTYSYQKSIMKIQRNLQAAGK